MSIKVNLGDYRVIFSESFVITHNNNIISLDGGDENGGFKLKLVFETKKSKTKDGSLVANIVSEVDDGLTLTFQNLFSVEAAASAKGLIRFFTHKFSKQGQESYTLCYYFSFSSQSLSDADDAILFNLNIATKPEVKAQGSED